MMMMTMNVAYFGGVGLTCLHSSFKTKKPIRMYASKQENYTQQIQQIFDQQFAVSSRTFILFS